MNKYISKFQRDVEKLLADDFENPEKKKHIEKVINDVIARLDIGTNGYAFSDVRDTLNKKLKCGGKAWLFSTYLNWTSEGIIFYKFTFLGVCLGFHTKRDKMVTRISWN